MAKAPVLTSGPVRLIPFASQHLTEDYVGWLNDPAVMRFSENRHRRHTMESCRAYVARFEAGPDLLWAVELAEPPPRHIGNLSAHVDAANRRVDVGILLGAAGARGRGLGYHAWKAALDYLRGREDLDKVTGGCVGPNVAMLRIMEKCGMRPDGRRRSHNIIDGRRVDVVYMAADAAGSALGRTEAGP